VRLTGRQNPAAAFPVMMGSCALLMPAAAIQSIHLRWLAVVVPDTAILLWRRAVAAP
jgi:hypothetical protein